MRERLLQNNLVELFIDELLNVDIVQATNELILSIEGLNKRHCIV